MLPQGDGRFPVTVVQSITRTTWLALLRYKENIGTEFGDAEE